MKIFPIFIVTTTIISAVYSIKQIKEHTEFVRQCVLMLESISILLQHNNLTSKEILTYIHDSNQYSSLFFIDKTYDSSDFVRELNEQLNKNSKVIDDDDKKMLKGFFSMFGKTDLNGQLANCKMYKELFSKKLNVLEEKEQISCKTTLSVHIGIGVCAVIIFI